MDCEGYRESLMDAALGAIAPRHEAELRSHLASCPACRAELEAQQQLVAAIDQGVAASVAGEPSASFAARVRQRLAEERLPARSWAVRWAPVAAGALAVLVLVTVWLVRREAPVPEVSRSPAIAQPPQQAESPGEVSASGAVPSPPAERPPQSAPAHRGSSGAPLVARAGRLEVLVPPGEQETVLRFYAAVWSGRVDVSAVLAPPKPLELEELKISPLEVPPLEAEARPAEPGTLE